MDAKTSLERFRNKRKYTAQVKGISLGDLVSAFVDHLRSITCFVGAIEMFRDGSILVTVREEVDTRNSHSIPIEWVRDVVSKNVVFEPTTEPQFHIGAAVQVPCGDMAGTVGKVSYMFNKIEDDADEPRTTGWRYAIDSEGSNTDFKRETFAESHLCGLSESDYAASLADVSHEIVDEEDILLL